jgi:hypothetical protein
LKAGSFGDRSIDMAASVFLEVIIVSRKREKAKIQLLHSMAPSPGVIEDDEQVIIGEVELDKKKNHR